MPARVLSGHEPHLIDPDLGYGSLPHTLRAAANRRQSAALAVLGLLLRAQPELLGPLCRVDRRVGVGPRGAQALLEHAGLERRTKLRELAPVQIDALERALRALVLDEGSEQRRQTA